MLSDDDKYVIREELLLETGGKLDGSRRNILVSPCPNCGKEGYKFGIYVGFDTNRKVFGSSHCFKCGVSYCTLKETLSVFGREDLMPKEVEDLDEPLVMELNLFEDDEIDTRLVDVKMPDGYKRCYRNAYLRYRGFVADDYEYFEVGTNRGYDRKLADYVIFPIKDDGRYVGYVARHTWDKDEIDEFNLKHRYKIRRYVNSTDNGFAKLLYNYDAVIKYKTDVVVLVEGVFDCIALTRKMELYDNHTVVPVCTFGKKVSVEQMMKLQDKNISTVVIGFDADAVETTMETARNLDEFFDVYICDLSECEGKDFDEMSVEDVYNIFAYNLKTVREFCL